MGINDICQYKQQAIKNEGETNEEVENCGRLGM